MPILSRLCCYSTLTLTRLAKLPWGSPSSRAVALEIFLELEVCLFGCFVQIGQEIDIFVQTLLAGNLQKWTYWHPALSCLGRNYPMASAGFLHKRSSWHGKMAYCKEESCNRAVSSQQTTIYKQQNRAKSATPHIPNEKRLEPNILNI